MSIGDARMRRNKEAGWASAALSCMVWYVVSNSRRRKSGRKSNRSSVATVKLGSLRSPRNTPPSDPPPPAFGPLLRSTGNVGGQKILCGTQYDSCTAQYLTRPDQGTRASAAAGLSHGSQPRGARVPGCLGAWVLAQRHPLPRLSYPVVPVPFNRLRPTSLAPPRSLYNCISPSQASSPVTRQWPIEDKQGCQATQ